MVCSNSAQVCPEAATRDERNQRLGDQQIGPVIDAADVVTECVNQSPGVDRAGAVDLPDPGPPITATMTVTRQSLPRAQLGGCPVTDRLRTRLANRSPKW